MANKNKKSAIPTAPKTNTKKTETVDNKKKVETVEVLQVKDLKNLTKNTTGLDANHRVDLLNGLKAYFHDDEDAKDKFGQDVTDTVNRLTAIGFATAFLQEAFYGDSKWAATMRSSQATLLKQLAPTVGYTIDEKLLPAPDSAGNVTIPAAAVKIPTETKKKLENEKKVMESKPIIDPTKIENEDQLKNSLTFMLSDVAVKRPYDRMTRATEFLRSYQLLQASKGGDSKKTELDAIKSKSVSDLLEEIRKLVGEIPFSTVGISHFIYSKLCAFNNPIFSFCLMRNASKNKETGDTPVDDNMIAAMVRTLVNWTNEPKLEEYTKNLKRAKEELKAGTKKQDYVDAIQNNVDYCTSHFEAVTNCPTDFADHLIENLESDDANTKKAAQMTVSMILKSYYPTLESTDAAGDNKEQLLKDIQQRAGIITNLFRDPLSQDIRYNEANLTYEAPKDEKTEETKN